MPGFDQREICNALFEISAETLDPREQFELRIFCFEIFFHALGRNDSRREELSHQLVHAVEIVAVGAQAKSAISEREDSSKPQLYHFRYIRRYRGGIADFHAEFPSDSERERSEHIPFREVIFDVLLCRFSLFGEFREQNIETVGTAAFEVFGGFQNSAFGKSESFRPFFIEGVIRFLGFLKTESAPKTAMRSPSCAL